MLNALPLRILSRVMQNENGCWIWLGAKQSSGYAEIRDGKKVVLVHRKVYEQLVGPIPEGEELDHFRMNPGVDLPCAKCCIRPSHLESVPKDVHRRRGRSPSGVNARKTACPAGHTYKITPTRRRCLECDRNNARERKKAA